MSKDLDRFVSRSGREKIRYRGFFIALIDGFYVIREDSVTVSSVQTTEEAALRWIDAHADEATYEDEEE